MYTQFFGNYLLSKGLVTSEQMVEAIRYTKTVHLKLGMLAIHAGYMTSGEVEQVHILQTRISKPFGELAVAEGFLTPEQVTELLSAQKPGFLLLGQALIERGYISTNQFESVLSAYQSEFEITDNDFSEDQTHRIDTLIQDFYYSNRSENSAYYLNYITLLFNNLIRFIGEDFTPFKASAISAYPSNYCVSQVIKGSFSAYTAIDMDRDTFITFASRYAGENFSEFDEYVKASVEDFLNLHNGLFAVNMSNDHSIDLTLNPPIHENNCIIAPSAFLSCIPVSFSFGTINFLISNLE
ncbi:chemotaxis protein CheX [Anaerobium acetethylicum]|uniref:Chemotaxis phosphatase CheX n=1 Tax=Anaerobium acetethylicum TaxID=1619234 RepID=A0A1D3TP30_9FIRM|nr:chemotaxis protein CheX [Anaerobium acetethylicum]SCP95118.1 hypothetical protein SAMN05421730_1001329 [Anaerobium acetethylicum]